LSRYAARLSLAIGVQRALHGGVHALFPDRERLVPERLHGLADALRVARFVRVQRRSGLYLGLTRRGPRARVPRAFFAYVTCQKEAGV
jgi:hypothetical protein